MPAYEPPQEAARLRVTTLHNGTQLWRVHSTQIGGTDFARHGDGPRPVTGRFDSTEGDQFAFIYLASTQRGSIAESILLDAPFESDGSRRIELPRLENRGLAEIILMEDLRLISLMSSEGLAAAHQDHWLIQAD